MLRQLVLLLSFLSVFCLGAASAAQAVTFQKLEIDGIRVAAWLPSGAGSRTTTVIFSHSFGGCNTAHTFVLEAMANAGYAVFAPEHSDSMCDRRNITKPIQLAAPLYSPELWNAQSHADRRDDIKKLLDMLPQQREFKSLDWNKTVLAGHSLGGYVALGMAGAFPEWKDDRVKFVIAMSPYAKPFLLRQTIANIGVPVMYQGGSSDWLNDDIKITNGLYAQTVAPKMYVELARASHLVWSSTGGDVYKRPIIDYTVAFLDYYIKGKPLPEELLNNDGTVSDLRTESMNTQVVNPAPAATPVPAQAPAPASLPAASQ
jgi:predicted dienelactone hydrolase